MLSPMLLSGLLLLPVFHGEPVVHPHVPKVVSVDGAAGSIAFRYFTVPYNAKHLEGLRDGSSWHVGFAQLVSEVPFEFGGVTVPAGEFKLDAVRGTDNGSWNLRLVPLELWGAKRSRRGRDGLSRDELVERVSSALKEKGIAEVYEIPAESHLDAEADPSDHADLGFEVVNRGYVTLERRTWKPASGVEGSFRIAFGPIHVEAAFAESFTPPKTDSGRERRR